MKRTKFLLARLLFAAVLCCSGMAVPERAQAQASRGDSAAVLLEAARRFEMDGRTSIADALMEMILERFGDTAAAAEVRRLQAALPAERGTRSGAVELSVWSALYGLWLGVAVPLIADSDGPEAYGVGLLVGGPVGFLVGRTYARSRPISEGQARAITWGGTWGSWQGLGWGIVLDLGAKDERICPPLEPCFEVEGEADDNAVVASMVAGGVAGIAVGSILSRKPISRGLATTVSFGSLWGTWFGVAFPILVGEDDGDNLLTATLVGGNIGLVATAILGPRWQLSRNRARLISIAGVLGGLAGGGLDLIIQPDNEKVAIAIPLAGSIAGLAIGASSTRDTGGEPDGGGDLPGVGLLRLERGRLSLDVPVPQPALLRAETPRGTRYGPGVIVPLVQARF